MAVEVQHMKVRADEFRRHMRPAPHHTRFHNRVGGPGEEEGHPGTCQPVIDLFRTESITCKALGLTGCS